MANSSRRTVLRLSAFKIYLSVAVLLVASILALGLAKSAEAKVEDSKTVGGLTVYLGVVPAEIVRGARPYSAEQPMHGRTPRGAREYHIVVAVYDSVSNMRITDATVTARVSGLGLAGPERRLSG